MVETTNDEFTYCVLLPERIENNKYIEGKAFGVGPSSDSTESYDKIFKITNNMYKVLSMCIYEVRLILVLTNISSLQRYDFGKISPRFAFKQPEFMLRCFCNFDNCNREKNFFGYINNLKADSALLAANTPVNEPTRH
jgi:hypothetical protein